MDSDSENSVSELNDWGHFISGFHLPLWDELPTLELYMDQIILLLSGYLRFSPQADPGGRVISAATVNSYVRTKIIPPPVKKKYGRLHMAYLIMICILKQSLSVSYIQRLVPPGMNSDEMQKFYNDFVSRHFSVSQDFAKHIDDFCRDISADDGDIPPPFLPIAVNSAITANLYSLLTEKIANLQSSASDKSCADPSTK